MHRKERLYITLAGFFITNAILAEIVGGKIFTFDIPPLLWFTQTTANLSVGVLVWPIVFIMTDIINEYYGIAGVRRVTLLTIVLISYVFVALFFMGETRAASFSAINDENFNVVFGTSQSIIIGSLVAFAVGQFLDFFIFHRLKMMTGNSHLWLRATGSTVFSQLIDTFIVLYIAFVIPGKWTMADFLKVASSNYLYKLGIAVAVTPVIYLVHAIIDNYLGKEEH
ncbi:MAG TPA: queuosine precursor transporter [Turneriella sp.]|nr:queuosine precursor transporter [Turneriella sp.]HNA78076.1 queuosine precursor transporter [Turneriella sp.]HNE19150.1 queuosine precursor transporter [Turneriella sp.]HNJ65182.1 queuosine precursor transporter [Turneriella sp.]HNL10212.1 queuosine precursor transporter [Turneriella sp.]